MLLSKKPTVDKPAAEETTRLFLDFSSEPLPYNGVRLTLDLIDSRSRLLISETENLIALERIFSLSPAHPLARRLVEQANRGDILNLIGILALLGIRSI